jgi:hypothetical protein
MKSILIFASGILLLALFVLQSVIGQEKTYPFGKSA